MAAKTPSSVKVLSVGNGLVVRKAVFADIDNADTWTSGLKGVSTVVAVDNTGTTTAGVAVSESGGVFTFACATDNKAVTLRIESL